MTQNQNILNLFDPLTVSEVHQRALLIKKQSRSGSLAWTTPPDQTPISSATTAFVSVGVVTTTAPQPLPTPPDVTLFSRPSCLDAMRCFSWSKPDHWKTACPKLGKRTLLVDGMELEGFDDVIVDDDILEDDILEEQVHGDTSILLILRCSCFSMKQFDNSWLRKSLFHSTYTMSDKVCHFISTQAIVRMWSRKTLFASYL